MKSREPRQDVHITVRFVSDAGWADAEIRNVSSGGLMAVSPCPPSYGSYVEIRRESYSIVGRVVWSAHGRFGVQAREKIVLAELARPKAGKAEDGERRKQPRAEDLRVRRPPPGELAEASARQARAIDFVLVSVGAATCACAVAALAGQAMNAQLAEVREVLAGSSSG